MRYLVALIRSYVTFVYMALDTRLSKLLVNTQLSNRMMKMKFCRGDTRFQFTNRVRHAMRALIHVAKPSLEDTILRPLAVHVTLCRVKEVPRHSTDHSI
jgi:hypothetical protein